ncbi:hypothetical protein EB001_03945 [bacterium]|nr:hypothetical protein [bacterium]
MSLSIVITDSEKTITNNINDALSKLLNDTIKQQQNKLVDEVKLLIPNWINQQPEIISLQSVDSSSLAGLFGINQSIDSIINKIISSVVDSTTVKFVPYNNKFRGGLEINIQTNDFNNLLGLPEGHTIYKGGDLHWMDWLLLRGDSIIISNYQYNPSTGLGRSGLGTMISGGSFRVPPQFAGTKDNNFITRALIGSNQEQQISNIFSKILG